MHFKQILDLIKNSVTARVDDDAPSMGKSSANSNTYGSKAAQEQI